MVRARHRKILVGLAAVALGAATTIGIAWGASLQSSQGMSYSGLTWRYRDQAAGEGHGVVNADHMSTLGWRMTWVQTFVPFPIRSASIPTIAPELVLSEREIAMAMPWLSGSRPWPTIESETVCVHEFGWPLRCLYARSIDVSGSVEYKRLWKLPEVPFFSRRGRYELPGLPKGIFGAEFAGDAAIWSGVWWFMLLVPGKFRSWWRRRGARCVACAYDLRGLPPGSPCPECGYKSPALPGVEGVGRRGGPAS